MIALAAEGSGSTPFPLRHSGRSVISVSDIIALVAEGRALTRTPLSDWLLKKHLKIQLRHTNGFSQDDYGSLEPKW